MKQCSHKNLVSLSPGSLYSFNQSNSNDLCMIETLAILENCIANHTLELRRVV